MKIVVTQDQELSDVQKERLDSLGDVTYFDTFPSSPAEYLERVKDVDIICSGTSGLKDAFRELKNQYVTVSFVSVAFVDLNVLTKNNVRISNAPGVNRHAVSEWILFMSLLATRDFNHYVNQTDDLRRDGKLPSAGPGLARRNITILGNGNVGRQVARVFEAMDATVRIFKRDDDLCQSVRDADLVIDTLGSNSLTTKLLDSRFFSAMKVGSSFITVSRQEIVDENALFAALDNGHISQAFSDCGASLGADTSDPYYRTLIAHPKITATPHIAFNSQMSHVLGNDVMIDNVDAWIQGKPQNLLN